MLQKRPTSLVTGANRGLGLQIARQLAAHGHHVVLAGRNLHKLEAAASQLQSLGGIVETLLLDTSDPESIAAAATDLAERNLQLQVLVNNAGICLGKDQNLSADPEELLQRSLQTNSLGPLRIVRAFLPFLQRNSRVIMISSGGGAMGDGPAEGWSPAYCSSKTLLNAFTRHLALELAPQGIAVNAVCPGWVRTDMGGPGAPRSLEEGAETPVWLALDAPITQTGCFFRDKMRIPW